MPLVKATVIILPRPNAPLNVDVPDINDPDMARPAFKAPPKVDVPEVKVAVILRPALRAPDILDEPETKVAVIGVLGAPTVICGILVYVSNGVPPAVILNLTVSPVDRVTVLKATSIPVYLPFPKSK